MYYFVMLAVLLCAAAVWLGSRPDRPGRVRPYLFTVALLLTPLLVIVVMQAMLGQSAGACVERPINNAPIVVAVVSLLLAAVVIIRAQDMRPFAAGMATVICLLTFAWTPAAVMSLAGCWV